jgi:hypothetical protein
MLSIAEVAVLLLSTILQLRRLSAAYATWVVAGKLQMWLWQTGSMQWVYEAGSGHFQPLMLAATGVWGVALQRVVTMCWPHAYFASVSFVGQSCLQHVCTRAQLCSLFLPLLALRNI